MPRFAANLSMLFTESPFLARFERAAKAGFEAVEFVSPYDHPVAEIKARLDATGLQLVLHNLPAGNWDAGERGIACLPARTSDFRSRVARAIEYASALGVPQLSCVAGKVPPDASDELIHDTFVANLRFTPANSASSDSSSWASRCRRAIITGTIGTKKPGRSQVFKNRGNQPATTRSINQATTA